MTRFSFPAFDLGPVHLFANTGDPHLDEELAERVFADAVMPEVLLRNGYVQIGWPVGVWYDPVCFDMNERRAGGEVPIVHLDHEVALQHERVLLKRRLANSFLDLMTE